MTRNGLGCLWLILLACGWSCGLVGQYEIGTAFFLVALFPCGLTALVAVVEEEP